MAIWRQHVDLDTVNAWSARTLMQALEIRITEIGNDFLRGTMPVDDRTRQPYGILHGGASVALAETLGSTAASWAALGDVESASGDAEDATRCYANAWKCEQGEAIAPGPIEAGIDTAHVTLEERDEHGMPRLPGEQSSPAR